jgi:hypothetical protein
MPRRRCRSFLRLLAALALAHLTAAPTADAGRLLTKRSRPNHAATITPARPGTPRSRLRNLGSAGRTNARHRAAGHVAEVEGRIAELELLSRDLAAIELEIRARDRHTRDNDDPIETREPSSFGDPFAGRSPTAGGKPSTERGRLLRWRAAHAALMVKAGELRGVLGSLAETRGARWRAVRGRLDRLILGVAVVLADRHEAIDLLRVVIARPGVDRATRRRALDLAADLYVAQLVQDLRAFGLSPGRLTFTPRFAEDGTQEMDARPEQLLGVIRRSAVQRMRTRVGWRLPWPPARRPAIARLEQALVAVIGAGESPLSFRR